MKKLNGFISAIECAKEENISKEAIYRLIRIGKLKSYKDGGRVFISKQQYEEIKQKKYKRFPRDENGHLIFTKESGNMSVFYARQYIQRKLDRPFTLNHLYYSIYNEKIKSKRIGYTWVLNVADLDCFILNNPKHPKRGKKPKKSVFS